MRLVIVRHGEPDYSIDSLTPRGWKEAEILSERISRLDVKDFYCSPLGRARDTAKATLAKMGRQATTLEWLREFAPRMQKPWQEGPWVLWDWLPSDWTKEPRFYDADQWMHVPVFAQAGAPEEYAWVSKSLDDLLAGYGYVRDGLYYLAEKPNEDTIVLFCHFGLECVLLGHLLHVSPMILWHGFCAAPTSVTTVVTEERREGIAAWRVSAFGDTSHLYAAGMEPSTAARFAETYHNPTIKRD